MMLYDKLEQYHLILASRSPRRQQLIKELGINVDIILPGEEDESFPPTLQGPEIPLFIAKAKAAYFKGQLEAKDIVITADTIVYLENKVLGKPADKKEAIEMIRQLSGKCHSVYTAVCLTSVEQQLSFYSETKVFFRVLQEEEIEYYVDLCKPFDKAGAYGVQEWIGYTAIERIEGSYFNVVGLPVDKLWYHLAIFLDMAQK